MAQKTKNPSFRALIDRFTDELTAAIAAQVEEQVAAALSHLRAGGAHSDGRRSGRVCPVPGCGKPGAGPRNRWFCKEHARRLSASEQKGILERNRRLLSEGKAESPAQRIVRLPARTPRPRRALDMSCRVEGCTNRSRGPRAGYICDQHRAELSSEQQEAARRTWNARRKGQALPAPDQPKAPPAPVPPIVRKAEPAEA
ncbi:MAG TPA: hypothetical protein VFP52_15640 [Myxococcales bacterium]|nr:hypothetical protein [Myxococcales bacterium]